MKFAHLADCHIGSWRDPKLRELGIKSFEKAIDICINEHVAFILICGDLFNTALPSIELIKETASIFQKARDHDISVYVIPGSHDYSPSNKTILDVFEKSGLLENVAKFEEIDGKIVLNFAVDKTSTKITGIYGKRTGLDRFVYQKLNKEILEKEKGFKIFMFHCGINEFKTMAFEKLDFESLNSFPKNFNYYAGGHIHHIYDKEIKNYGLFVYPGPLFPNNFEEVETLKHGSFVIADVNGKNEIKIRRIAVKFYDTLSLGINVDGLTSYEANLKIRETIENSPIENKVVTLRISGVLKSGKLNDINFKEIYSKLEKSYTVLKNTSKLTTKEYEEVKIESGSLLDIESRIIKSNLGNLHLQNIGEEEEEILLKDLLSSLLIEKNEAEKAAEFESRVSTIALKILNISELWENAAKKN
ncbi:exonuclease SbcCD subunit D [Candidatus Woesearchaeota archaeon]|nr:exonuclease SbcCD subunit D [Candidatus Woesearchaeota archaeon]